LRLVREGFLIGSCLYLVLMFSEVNSLDRERPVTACSVACASWPRRPFILQFSSTVILNPGNSRQLSSTCLSILEVFNSSAVDDDVSSAGWSAARSLSTTNFRVFSVTLKALN
jgi:hypothetical protein